MPSYRCWGVQGIASLSAHPAAMPAPALAAVPVRRGKPSAVARTSWLCCPGRVFSLGLQNSALRGRFCRSRRAQQELKYVCSILFIFQTALAGRAVPRFIPRAKRQPLQEAAQCVQQLQLSLRPQGSRSSAAPLLRTHPARPARGCSRGGLDCADAIPLQIRCWSLARLPVIKGVKLCHGLNSAGAAKLFPSTLNCPDLGMS